jgi:hypothetical protein
MRWMQQEITFSEKVNFDAKSLLLNGSVEN